MKTGLRLNADDRAFFSIVADAVLANPFGTERADRVSIYRALEAFVEKGLVHRAFVDDRTWLYETADRCGEDHCHPHFTCRVCGRVQCLVTVEVPIIKDMGPGFVAERQQIHISGLCPACSAAAAGD